MNWMNMCVTLFNKILGLGYAAILINAFIGFENLFVYFLWIRMYEAN